jgi:hypothetical protein
VVRDNKSLVMTTMGSVSYALYAKALKGENAGEYVMCWNFDDRELATAVALQRIYDVGTVILCRHQHEMGTGKLLNSTMLDVFIRCLP